MPSGWDGPSLRAGRPVASPTSGGVRAVAPAYGGKPGSFNTFFFGVAVKATPGGEDHGHSGVSLAGQGRVSATPVRYNRGFYPRMEPDLSSPR